MRDAGPVSYTHLLKNAYIIKCARVVKDENGNVTEVICTYDPTTKSGGENSGKKVKGTLHWVEAESAVKAQARLLDSLFVEQEDGTMIPNENSMVVLDHVMVEPHIKTAQKRCV